MIVRLYFDSPLILIARRFGGITSARRQFFVDGLQEDERVDMAFQFFFLLRAETNSANLTLAIGKGFDDAGDIPIIARRIFGDENDVANLDIAATSGPLWALL